MAKTPFSPVLDHNVFGRRENPPLVLVNGLGGVQAAWLHQVRQFPERWLTVTYDHRGVGLSEVVDAPCTMDDFVSDLLRLLDFLEIGRASFVGLSFGGRVLQHLAVTAPERVTALILCCTSAGGAHHVPGDPAAHAALERAGELTEEDWKQVLAPALFGRKYRELHPDRIAGLARWRARNPADPRGIACQWQAYRSFDMSARLGEIRAPTMVLHGDEDALSPVENAHRLARGIRGARLEILEGVGHSPNVEVPHNFNGMVEEFLIGVHG